MNRKMLLVYLAVIVLLIVNSVQHFCSPVYRFYREKTESIEERYNAFVKKVEMDLVPAIMATATNRSATCKHAPLKEERTAGQAASAAPPPARLNAAIYRLDGEWCFRYHGFDFQAGDSFGGSRIVSIDNLGVTTTRCRYVFTKNEIEGGAGDESRISDAL